MTYAPNATGPFYHGTRADLAPGDLLAPGFTSNYADRKLSWIYFSGPFDRLRANGPRRGDLGVRAGQGRGPRAHLRRRADRRV